MTLNRFNGFNAVGNTEREENSSVDRSPSVRHAA
jgi:hypothetical protein